MTTLQMQEPAYKIYAKGSNYLTDIELLSIVISGKDSINKSEMLLNANNFDFNSIFKMTTLELVKSGLLRSQATKLIASIELAKRKQIQYPQEKTPIKCSRDIFEIIKPYFEDLTHEEFFCIFLNRSNKILKIENISVGGISGTITDVRIIFKKAVLLTASGIIISHNHPSGNIQPSESDTKITQKIKEAGNLMDIKLLDHIIYSEKDFYSFTDNGTI